MYSPPQHRHIHERKLEVVFITNIAHASDSVLNDCQVVAFGPIGVDCNYDIALGSGGVVRNLYDLKLELLNTTSLKWRHAYMHLNLFSIILFLHRLLT